MKYNISAMVVYSDSIEANSEEEAIDIFCSECPYDVDGNTIECEMDFEDYWDKLDDIEREEYSKYHSEEENYADSH